MPGYPDWQPGAPGPNLMTIPSGPYPVGITDTPIQASNGRALFFRIIPTGSGQCQVVLRQFNDQAGTVNLDTVTWHVNNLCGLAALQPVNAPYFSIRINNTGAGACPGSFLANVVDQSVPNASYPVNANRIIVSSESIAASGSAFHHLSRIQKGLAYLIYFPNDATGQLSPSLVTADEANVPTGEIWAPQALTTETKELIAITDDHVMFQIFNADAGAPHVYSFFLTPAGL